MAWPPGFVCRGVDGEGSGASPDATSTGRTPPVARHRAATTSEEHRTASIRARATRSYERYDSSRPTTPQSNTLLDMAVLATKVRHRALESAGRPPTPRAGNAESRPRPVPTPQNVEMDQVRASREFTRRQRRRVLANGAHSLPRRRAAGSKPACRLDFEQRRSW